MTQPVNNEHVTFAQFKERIYDQIERKKNSLFSEIEVKNLENDCANTDAFVMHDNKRYWVSNTDTCMEATKWREQRNILEFASTVAALTSFFAQMLPSKKYIPDGDPLRFGIEMGLAIFNSIQKSHEKPDNSCTCK